MKIISKFKDYYDHNMIAMGMDPNITYIRETQDIEPGINTYIKRLPHNAPYKTPVMLFPGWYWYENKMDKFRNSRLTAHWIAIGDVVYYYWRFESHSPGRGPTSKNNIVTYIWDVRELKTLLEDYRSYLIDKQKPLLPWNKFHTIVKFDIPRNGFFEQYPIITGLAAGSHRCAKPKEITANPKLKDIKFQNVLSDTQIWQILEMWLAKERPVAGTTDSEATKLLQHGMDKTSFRRESHPSKPRSK